MFAPESELQMKEGVRSKSKKHTNTTVLYRWKNTLYFIGILLTVAFEWQAASLPAVTGSRPSSSRRRAEIDVFWIVSKQTF